tara:strand:+ start:186 stop:830 length:645 start_codon:yes stop_codon:yes gene_type:complete
MAIRSIYGSGINRNKPQNNWMVRKRIAGITYYPHNENGDKVTGYKNEHDAARAFNRLLQRFVREGKMSASKAEKKMKTIVDVDDDASTASDNVVGHGTDDNEDDITVLSSKRKRNDAISRRCKRARFPPVAPTEVVFEASCFDWKEADEIFRSEHPEHSSTWPIGWHSPESITFLSSFWDLLPPSSTELTGWQTIEATKELVSFLEDTILEDTQ